MKLDIKTLLFLYITRANIKKTPEIINIIDKDKSLINSGYSNDVYVFKNYEEFKAFFEMYMDSVDESMIEKAIYTRGSKGQVVALKSLCSHIIKKNEVEGFYDEKLVQTPVLKKSKVRPI